MMSLRQRRYHRLAVTGLFALTGLAMSLWVVNIPAVQASTGTSKSVLGLLLLFLGCGSILGMQVAGWMSDRWGSRRVAGAAVVVIALAVNGPGLATAPWHLALTLPLLGLGAGSITVAANDQAVTIQDAYGRPIMSSFHGFFSVAGAAGAGLGAILHAAHAPVQVALATASIGAATIGALCVPGLVGPRRAGAVTADDDAAGTPGTPEVPVALHDDDAPSVLRRAVALALLSFLLMLAEGTATDWSAVHGVEHLGLPESTASLGYAAFATAMTVGRFAADRAVARSGPVLLVRAGSAVAGVGLATVVLAPTYPMALAGWVAFGLGLSGIVPQLFTAAGSLSATRRGAVLSRVVGAGYLGQLAGPAVIGWLADAVGVNTALLAPLVSCVAGVLLASAARPRRPAPAPSGAQG